MMLFIKICLDNLLIFSISALTVLQFWFLRDGNIVFYSYIILFKFFKFICPVWCGCAVFLLLLVCGSFRLERSCFSVFGVSIIVLMYCLGSLFISWRISNISTSESTFLNYRPNLVSESLLCCLEI